ncbi:Gp15 family bacteriophage protein [Enterococcus gallinarum]|uniref:Gp15 family bacteriophage protein n=1 Tax=Enterococcus gallinarum TaxID=1353 RepID=UPI00255AE92A|nr:Gp15 family bacteriophage protein [Enterococcus gallinarum]MDL4908430.1 Gp15 family bacteriophage protein [Enterococcus gallinarum]
MRLNDPLTTEIEFEGITYPLDLAFDNVLDVLDAISDKSLMAWEKVDLALNLLVGESNLTFEKQMELWELILNQHIQIGSQEKVIYDLEGNPMPTPKSSDDKKSMDLVQDAKYIYASFRQIGINLFEEQGKMHWEEFQAILESLPDDTILPKIVQIRNWSPSKGESEKEKERMRELQAKYSLSKESSEVDADG